MTFRILIKTEGWCPTLFCNSIYLIANWENVRKFNVEKKIYKHFESFQLIQPQVPGSLSSLLDLLPNLKIIKSIEIRERNRNVKILCLHNGANVSWNWILLILNKKASNFSKMHCFPEIVFSQYSVKFWWETKKK